MGTFVIIVVFAIVFWALLTKNHKTLIFLSILSIFADNFRLAFGASLLLVNCIGFLILPILLQERKAIQNKIVSFIFKPLLLEFCYLILLGFIFGFIFPWEDSSGYRMWTQRASGRTIVTLIRLLNEIILGYYFILVIIKKKITIKFIVYSIGYATLFSFLIGIIDYFIGYQIKASLFYIVPELSNRFLGLNGEPKMFGRNSALAYAIIFLYYLKIESNNKVLVVFLVVNLMGVFLSLSASSLILFFILNGYLFYNMANSRLIFISLGLLLTIIFFINKSSFLNNDFGTNQKIEMALKGKDTKVIPNEPQLFSRFDVFDRLALVYLFENPVYAIIGVGPNLISIPASQYVNSLNEYATFAERGGIDSVPNVMFNNIISSSGIIGIILYGLLFIRLRKIANRDKSGFCSGLVFICFVFNMVYFSIVLIFLTGIIVGRVCQLKKQAYIRSKNSIPV